MNGNVNETLHEQTIVRIRTFLLSYACNDDPYKFTGQLQIKKA